MNRSLARHPLARVAPAALALVATATAATSALAAAEINPSPICTLPGQQAVADKTGDETGDPVNSQLDITGLDVAEPYVKGQKPTDAALTFTIKLANANNVSTATPNAFWKVFFNAPGSDGATHTFVVLMETTRGAVQGFNWGFVDTTTPGLTRTTYECAQSATTGACPEVTGGFDATNNQVVLVFDTSKPLTYAPVAAGSTQKTFTASFGKGTVLSAMYASTQLQAGAAGGSSQPVPTNLNEAVDSTSMAPDYTVQGNLFCAPNSPPVAALVTDKTAGTLAAPAPESLPVAFDATGSSDPDVAVGDTVARYDFSFGDGGTDAGNTTGRTNHSYTKAGTYKATVQVTDSRGKASAAPAMVTIAVADDLKADPLSFAPQTDVPPNVTVTSEELTVSGITAPIPITVSGGYASGYSLNGAPFTGAAGTVVNGDKVTVRHNSGASDGTAVDTVLTLGSGANATTATFSSVTKATPRPTAFTFATRRDVADGVIVSSEAITLGGTAGASYPIGVAGGNSAQYALNGGAFTSAAGTIKVGDRLVVRHISAAKDSTTVTTTVTVGGYTTNFTSITGTHNDQVPDAFTFGETDNVTGGTVQTSPAVTPVNYDAAPVVAGPGMSYAINGGAFTSANGTIKKGQTITARLTSSSGSLVYTRGYISIGGVKGTFTTRNMK